MGSRTLTVAATVATAAAAHAGRFGADLDAGAQASADEHGASRAAWLRG